MEVLFENRFTYSEKYLREYFLALHFKSIRRILMDVFMVACLLVQLIASRGRSGKLTAIVLIAVPVYFLIRYFMFSLALKDEIKAQEEKGGEACVASTVVSEDGLRFAFSNEEKAKIVGLDRIKSVVVTRDYIFVISKSKRQYALKQDAFSVGDSLGFLDYIKGNGIKISRFFP